MNLKWIGISLLGLSLAAINAPKATALGASPASPSAALGQEHGDWDAPPQEFREIQRQGYHDGVEAARKDFDHHRHADADDHGEYKHPHVERSGREDYREGFRRGYERAMSHLAGHDRDHD